MSHTCDVLMECDYVATIDALKQQYGGFYHTHKHAVLVSKGSTYIGGLHQFVEHLQQTYDYTPMGELTDTRFMAESEAAMEHALSKLHATVCFLKFGMKTNEDDEEAEPMGRIIVELFDRLAPKVKSIVARKQDSDVFFVLRLQCACCRRARIFGVCARASEA